MRVTLAGRSNLYFCESGHDRGEELINLPAPWPAGISTTSAIILTSNSTRFDIRFWQKSARMLLFCARDEDMSVSAELT